MTDTTPDAGTTRRSLLSTLTNTVLVGGLLSCAGTVTAFVGRYLYPREGLRRVRSLFLAPMTDLPVGKARTYELLGGETAVVTNTGSGVVALSDVCPHLGCKVRWEEGRKGFHCPCHGGFFSKEGLALEGPPADEKKNLKRYELETVGENVFIHVEENIT